MKKALYSNIEVERVRRGLSKDEVAEKLGVSRKTYYNWVVKGNIPHRSVKRLAQFFNVSADYLLET